MTQQSLIKGDVTGIEFTPNIFPSQALALYLRNQVEDFLLDPEPQENDFCERVDKEELITLVKHLDKLIEQYQSTGTEK